MTIFLSRQPNPELEAELRKVAVEPKAVLRTRYVSLFGRDPPKAFGPDLLQAQRRAKNAGECLWRPVKGHAARTGPAGRRDDRETRANA